MRRNLPKTPLNVVTDQESDANETKAGQVDVIVDKIVEGIRYGEYTEGQQLVARSIANEMNVSVVPVREALARLAGEGVIELLQNRSPRVKRLSRREILDALEVWEVNAGLIARLAAQKINIRHNKSLLLEIKKALNTGRNKKSRLEFFSDILRLQVALSKIVDNAYVDRVTMSLHTELWTKRITDAVPDDDWREYIDDFVELIDMICTGDGKKAEKSYRQHINKILQRADEFLQ